jgi:hypothetical protein
VDVTAGPKTVTLTFAASGSTAGASLAGSSRSGGIGAALACGIVLAPLWRRKRAGLRFAVLAITVLGSLVACRLGGSSGHPSGTVSGTVTVTADATGAAEVSLPIQVVVQ